MKKIFDKVNETGTMLVEAMAMLGLIAMVTPILYKKAAERTTELQDINASNQLRVLADAMDAYIKDNFTRITDGEKVVNGCNVNSVDYAGFTDDTSVRFDISHLCEYLPYGFLKDGKTQDSKLFSSSETDNNSFQVVLRKTTGTETDEEGNWYFEDTYNIDYIWRLGYGLMGVRVMVTCGGPNIWVDTFEKTVHGYWGGDEAIAYLTNDCCEKIENIFGENAAEAIYNDRV